MCGLAGFFSDDGIGPQQPDRDPMALLSSMAAELAHRGPDGRGFHAAPGIGLAHLRLSIVGIADGAQPMATPDGRFVIAFNGEIFNHAELRRELEAEGMRLRTHSDTEVLLALFARDGEACLQRLNGDFVFAIWDGLARRLTIARDRMGVRPLFHAKRNGVLYFASEVKALLQVPGIEAELDPVALDQIFTFWAPIAPRTAFAGIDELEPGHVLVAEPGRMTIRPWWQPSFPDRDDHPRDYDPEALADELAALLGDATRLRLQADVPVGAYLSGGLDSSLIAALAAPAASNGLDTFSVTFDSAEHDESAFQQQVARALGTRHHAAACSAADIAESFPEVVRLTERPILRTAPAPLYRLSRLVRDNGMKVALTGEGADEVFAGYDIFREARVRRFCARQPGSRLRPHLFRRLYPYLPGLQSQSAEYLAAFFGVTGDPDADPLYSHRPRMRSTAAAKLFYSADLAARLKAYDAAEDLAARLPDDFRRWHPLNQAQYLESRLLLPGYILSSQGDRMAMAHGVETRFPFLDHRLVEFAARLPPEAKLKGLTEKHILRRIARDVLPDTIAARPKQPYRAPDSASFAGSGPQAPQEQPYVAALLGEDAIARHGMFEPRAVTRLLAKCRARPLTGFRDNAAFVGILSTQLWLDTFTATASNRAPSRQRTIGGSAS